MRPVISEPLLLVVGSGSFDGPELGAATGPELIPLRASTHADQNGLRTGGVELAERGLTAAPTRRGSPFISRCKAAPPDETGGQRAPRVKLGHYPSKPTVVACTRISRANWRATLSLPEVAAPFRDIG